MHNLHKFISSLLIACTAITAFGAPPAGSKTKAKAKPKTERSAVSKKKRRAATGKARPETSADVARREEAARREIDRTRREIELNDEQIKKNLASLSRIGADIDISKKHIAGLTDKVTNLEYTIGQYEADIAAREERLALMRSKYAQAVRKMRLRRGQTGTMAFIFSSDNFNQALRRMRYLKQFGEWRKRQTAQITSEVTALRNEREQLAETRDRHGRTLQTRKTAQDKLQQQYDTHNNLVATLRKNGNALNAHLARKQAEANELRNRVGALIAAEERAKAEAREKAEAQARLAEARRLQQQREQEQRELRAAEERARAEQAAKAEQNRATAKTDKKTDKKKDVRKDTRKTGKAVTAPDKSGSRTYADARRRKPRTDGALNVPAATRVESSSASTASTVQKASGFAATKGSLPRPVAGGFRVVSAFGPHPLPDLPTVTYDNPGIDAEVSPGASALAVYPGTVSGVYMLKGFSTVIIVSHGTHYTVYGNIASPAVRKGDSVRQGQQLGRVVSDADDGNRTVLHFEVWRGRQKLNPMEWIR